MTIDTIHTFIKQIALRKERLGFITDADIDLALDRGQLEEMEDKFKDYANTQELHDSLAPFETSATFSNVSGGTISLAGDYIHFLGMYTTVSGVRYPVRMYNKDEVVYAMNSQVRPPSITKPIAYQSAGVIQLYPEIIQSGVYWYLRRPAVPNANYTVNSTTRVVTYNAGASTQLEWNEMYQSNIIARALVYLGLELDEAGTVQFAQLQTQQTA